MKRLVGFFLLVASLSANGVHAQSDRPSQHGRTVVVVSSSAGDARLGLVDEAVSFWNKTFQEIGVCYSLGPVTRLVQPVRNIHQRDDLMRAIPALKSILARAKATEAPSRLKP